MNSVLIVEDEKAIAELIEMTLEPFGYACVKAFDGEQAADLVEREAFDLILLDVMLPGVDGFSLMEYIRPSDTPVIFSLRNPLWRIVCGDFVLERMITSLSRLHRTSCWRVWTA